jgi:hypothetical protein
LNRHYSNISKDKTALSSNPSSTYGSFRIRKIHKFKPTKNVVDVNMIMDTQNKLVIETQDRLERRKSARQSLDVKEKYKETSSALYLHKIEKISKRLSYNNPPLFFNLEKNK